MILLSQVCLLSSFLAVSTGFRFSNSNWGRMRSLRMIVFLFVFGAVEGLQRRPYRRHRHSRFRTHPLSPEAVVQRGMKPAYTQASKTSPIMPPRQRLGYAKHDGTAGDDTSRPNPTTDMSQHPVDRQGLKVVPLASPALPTHRTHSKTAWSWPYGYAYGGAANAQIQTQTQFVPVPTSPLYDSGYFRWR